MAGRQGRAPRVLQSGCATGHWRARDQTPQARTTLSGPLVRARELAEALDATTVLDVRWTVTGGADRDGYLNGHVPGAAFVDLDSELAAAPGTGGRHPLPDAAQFTAAMRRAGVSPSRPVVVYDDGGSLAAARAWWLLRYYGHPDVRVLDGGLAAWADGEPLAPGPAIPEPGDFTARPGSMAILDAEQAAELASRGVLLDARAPERYRGEVEPLDPVAGHVPGARNRPTTENLDPTGRFLEPAELRAEFERAGIRADVAVGAYCGSGVTAAHEVLALELAGFPAALYVGSWSDWITDPARPVATG